jgi:hypothetical protein
LGFTIVEDLNALSGAKYAELFNVAEKIGVKILADLVRKKKLEKTNLVLPLERLSAENAPAVGGKAANLGEVLNRAHLPVPPGFAVTAYAGWHFLEKNALAQFIQQQLKGLDIDDTEHLTAVSHIIQKRISDADPPLDLQRAIYQATAELQARFGSGLHLAVRSSATSEDGEATFAGQHTTVLNVAREFRIPTLVGTGTGTCIIPDGTEITVDAGHAVVYRGRVEALLKRKPTVNPMKGSPIYKAVQTAVQRIAPLNLTDPEKETFTPQGCQTIHDIIRFAHEMAMQAMFRINDAVRQERSIAIALRIPQPVNLFIVDLGGGLRPGISTNEARRDDVTSVPLDALLRGMGHEGVQWTPDTGVSWTGFASVMSTSILLDPLQNARLGGPSYAVVSHHYLNLNARLGYHFATIDTYCGPVINDNYLTFHFKGGAADVGRRSRRAVLLAEILSRMGFKVQRKIDLVRGQMKKYAMDQIAETLDMLGRLLGAVRLLDMVLADDRQVQWYVEEFFKGNYAFKKDFLVPLQK